MAKLLSQARQTITSRSFAERLPELREIHATAVAEILPRVLEDARGRESDTDMDDEVAEWLEDWLNDLGELFRVAKKHDFNVQNTLEAIRRTLDWRLRNLTNLPPPRPCSFLRFIPHPLMAESTRDDDDTVISTQPILLLSLQKLTQYANDSTLSGAEKVQELRNIMLSAYELSRMYLRDLDGLLQARQGPVAEDDPNRLRIVQFVLMVDVDRAGMLPNLGTDLASWLTKEVAPNYPGVCSAVYVVNYSWAYSAMWAVVKRVLPEKVLSRILFPSTSELLQHFSPECILKEHGGCLIPLSPDHDEVLARYQFGSVSHTGSDDSASSSSTVTPSPPQPHPRPLPSATSVVVATNPEPVLSPPTYLATFSSSNPFFGYPTIIHHRRLPDGSLSSVPELIHGRRRKRDLIKTLAFLYVVKWRRQIESWIRHLARAFKHSRSLMSKALYVLRTTLRVLDFGTLGAHLREVVARMPLRLAVAVTFATLLFRLRHALRSGGVNAPSSSQGLLSSLSRREMTWLRRVFMVALGLQTALILPGPSMVGVI
ncbi:hypothetical protein FRB95_011452 [Tulasnella sp. JGI-2019a]|nr:hypothetical protein FRB95_011452 [Tulasnella sp. JGI-2019a]